ncbi:MAG: hypothetical protein JNL30_16990 [Rubrivivax sp.]|nr:hypothetical protein [Rubrivivax sp.]
MQADDLDMLYAHLRRELDAAYAARPWDGRRIDRIAHDLLCLERTLASQQRPQPALRSLRPRSAA